MTVPLRPTVVRGRHPLHAEILGVLAEAASAYVLALSRRLRERRNTLRTFFILLCIGCSFAIGQGAPQPSAPPAAKPFTEDSYSFKASDLIGKISSQVTNRIDALRNNAPLHFAGGAITAFLLASLLVWTSLKTMASGRGLADLLGEWVPIFISLGMVTLFLDKSAGDVIVSTMDFITAAIGGADMSTLDSALSACVMPIFKAIAAVVLQPHVAFTAKIGGILDLLSIIVTGLASVLMGVVTKALAVFVLVVAAVGIMANVIMGFMSVQLVLALAPVMVPFLMFKPMEWLFSAWLKFLLGACMLKVVLAFLMGVVLALLQEMNELAHQVFVDAKDLTPFQALQSDVLLLGMSMVFAILATLLIGQAPKIAEGLLSGSAGATGFSGIKSIAGGTAGMAVSAAMSGVGGRIGQGIRNHMSTKQGTKDGQSGAAPSLKYRDPRAKAAYAEAYRDNKKDD